LILSSEKYFNRIYWILCLVIFLVIALRAFMIPFCHDEIATFFFYVQTDNYLPYKAHLYTNNHVLNSALANICYHVAGSHRFVLRIPNILAFLVMCYGISRYFRHLNSIFAKITLVAFFILTFNFLDFFELCRGYGLSLGFMILGLSYLVDYFKKKHVRHFFLFSVCWQLALAANLTLVVVLTILLGFVLIFQIKHKRLFKTKTLIVVFFNLMLLAFWIKFSLYYREMGKLDAGAGEDYWQVTFKSLINWIFGTENLWLQVLVIAGFAVIGIFALIHVLRSKFSLDLFFKPVVFYPLILVTLMVAFYLQKKILHVNFPEDRTGIFFYLFFVLSLAFVINELARPVSLIISSTLLAATVFYFCMSLNFTDFSSPFYYTIPKSMYDKLKSEYDKTGQIFTIGGHRVRELNYAFLNYRGGGMLNHMDDSEQMHMNCDYYYAMKREEPYYRFFYDEIGYNKKWDHVLLKRREKISRKEVAFASTPQTYKNNGEFFEFLRITDSNFRSKNCLEAELEITFNHVPKPFVAFLVFSIETTDGNTVYYKHVPLNMLADNLSGQTKYFKLTTGQMPADFKTAVVYIWNINQQEVDFTLKTLRIHELYGKGINFKIPETFYPLVEKITKRSLL
jgi:hypothetical protein